MEKIVIRAHMADLEDLHNASASEIVPWFFKTMPSLYFNLLSEDTRMFHLRALTALKDAGAAPELTLHNKERREVTFIRPGLVERFDQGGNAVVESSTSAQNVFKMMTELPPEAAQLSRVHFIRSLDDQMSLNVFEYGQQVPFGQGDAKKEASAKAELMQYCQDLLAGKYEGDPQHATPAEIFEPEQMEEYVANCGSQYVTRSNIRRFCRQRALFAQVSGNEGVAVEVEPSWQDASVGPNENATMISVASANVLPKAAMQKIVMYLSMYGFDCRRTHLDVVKDVGENNSVAMTRFLVVDPKSDSHQAVDWDVVKRDLKRLKWVDNAVIAMARDDSFDADKGEVNSVRFTLTEAEVCIALQRLMYGVLHKINPYAFTIPRIEELVNNNKRIARDISQLFIDRFDPANGKMDAEEFGQRQVILGDYKSDLSACLYI
jgi:glutamate dehydrogenase